MTILAPCQHLQIPTPACRYQIIHNLTNTISHHHLPCHHLFSFVFQEPLARQIVFATSFVLCSLVFQVSTIFFLSSANLESSHSAMLVLTSDTCRCIGLPWATPNHCEALLTWYSIRYRRIELELSTYHPSFPDYAGLSSRIHKTLL